MAARLYTLSRAHAHARTRMPHRSEVVIAHKESVRVYTLTREQDRRTDERAGVAGPRLDESMTAFSNDVYMADPFSLPMERPGSAW